MKKALYVATVVKTHIMQFHIPYLQMLKEEGWETAVAAKNDYENQSECNIPYCDTYFDIDFARQPFSKKNIKAYKELKHILDTENYDIVHCHTPVGGVLTRLAARKARKNGTKVIYTAHGFHFYKGAPLKNWLIYFPIEYICAFMTDVLITINQEDYRIAKMYFHAKRVEYVPGVGVDIDKFKTSTIPQEKKRKELGLNQDDFVLLSVGELIERKNHKVVLEAIARIKEEDRELYNKLQYLICGRGELFDYLIRLAMDLRIEESIHLLGYRNDINDICHAADLFVFPSLQEGLPVALMEAISCETPVICTDIRGCNDIVINKNNGVLIDFTVESLKSAICLLYKESDLREKYSENKKKHIRNYDIENVISYVKTYIYCL